MNWAAGIPMAAGLAAAPLLMSVINRTKAFFAGRQGPPLLQPYYELAKLLGKGAVYSRTTTSVFRAGPVVGLAGAVGVLALVPAAGLPALTSFPVDWIVFAYILALGRFFTVLAALDTGSAFAGMGASREAFFAALAEPAMFLALAALAVLSRNLSLAGILYGIQPGLWLEKGPALALVVGALFVVLLAENARIPVDDPNTHLELTMIHEAMLLDHCGVDLAFIQYGAALKLWAMSAILVSLVLPVRAGHPALDAATFLAGMAGLAVAVGVVESCMARLRLLRVPALLLGACALAALSLVLVLR